MLHSCPEQLKLGIGGARCVDKQLATKRKGIELVRNAQAFKLERGVNDHENMVAVGPQRSRGGLGQIRIWTSRIFETPPLATVFCRSW